MTIHASDRIRRMEQRLTNLTGRVEWLEGAYKRLVRPAKKATATKKNTQDLTLRNLKKTRADIASLVNRVKTLEGGK